MKGLMVALLTLFTASFAAAQEDDGGTFVLKLNEENFRALLRNEEGLIANIPEQARRNVTRVVVKLEDAVRMQEVNRTSAKPTAEPSSQRPTLDPATRNSARRPSTTQQSGGFRNPTQNPRERSQVEPITPVNRGGTDLTADNNFASDNNRRSTRSINPETFLPFGDDSDFAPVVRKDWLQRDRTTSDRSGQLGRLNDPMQTVGNFSQVNNEAAWQRQDAFDRQPILPNFERDRLLNQNRNRTNDLARREPTGLGGDFNNGSLRNQQFNDRSTVQPSDQNNELLREMRSMLDESQGVMNQQKLAMDTQQQEIEKLKLQILRERNEAASRRAAETARSESRPLRNDVAGNDFRSDGRSNYSDSLTQAGFNYPQDRVARNDRQPIVDTRNGVPPLQIQGNNDSVTGREGAQGKDPVRPKVNEDVLGNNLSLRKANNFLLFMLLASIGLNIYLGLISRTFYTRYEELADELRETFTATM